MFGCNVGILTVRSGRKVVKMDEEIAADPVKVADTVEPMSEPLPATVNGEVKINGEHVSDVEADKTDAPLRSPPQTAPKPSRESRTSKVFCKFCIIKYMLKPRKWWLYSSLQHN